MTKSSPSLSEVPPGRPLWSLATKNPPRRFLLGVEQARACSTTQRGFPHTPLHPNRPPTRRLMFRLPDPLGSMLGTLPYIPSHAADDDPRSKPSRSRFLRSRALRIKDNLPSRTPIMTFRLLCQRSFEEDRFLKYLLSSGCFTN
jgi:hypothetical protein